MNGWKSFARLIKQAMRLQWLAVGMSFALQMPLPAAVRVALMDVICDDNSHRSTLAAVDFTASLQAELSQTSGVEWIERVELAKAETEFRLVNFGIVDRFEAVRSGRWLRADWAVLGRISTNSPIGRAVLLEVVDLQRAESLVATNFCFSRGTNAPFAFGSAEVQRVAAALNPLLAHAREGYALAHSRPAVALLFLARKGVTPELAELEDNLRRELADAPADAHPIHLVRLHRADAAMSEADLVLSGLAQTDMGAWERVADQYLWGFYKTEKFFTIDRATERSRSDQQVQVTFNLWDGKGEPRMVTLMITNSGSGRAAARQLAMWLRSFAPAGVGNSSDDGLRRRISESLVAHASERAAAMPHPWSEAADARRSWLEVVRVLETACFFDPSNIMAREFWLRLRWARNPAALGGNEFFFARRRSEAWGKYVDQFGFRSVCPSSRMGWWDTNSVASEWVLSAWNAFRLLNSSQYEQAAKGVPLDADGKALLAWRRQFLADFATRFLTAPADPRFEPLVAEFFHGTLALGGEVFVLQDAQTRQRLIGKLWPRILEHQRQEPSGFDAVLRRGLRLHFEELGQPGGDRALLDEYEAIARAHAERPKPRTTRLPRVSELEALDPPKSTP